MSLKARLHLPTHVSVHHVSVHMEQKVQLGYMLPLNNVWISDRNLFRRHLFNMPTSVLRRWLSQAPENAATRKSTLQARIGSPLAFSTSMEVRTSNHQDTDYFGVNAVGSPHHSQPLMLAELLATLSALALRQDMPRPAGGTSRIQPAVLIGTRS